MAEPEFHGSEAMISQGLGRRGSDLGTPFETNQIILKPLSQGKQGRKEYSAGGATIGMDAFFTEGQKAAMKHVQEYKDASTAEKQLELWRKWMLSARKELASSKPGGEWIETVKQLAALPESLIDDGVIKSSEVLLEQQIVWKIFEARRGVSTSSGPVGENSAQLATIDIGGDFLNYIFGNVQYKSSGLPTLELSASTPNVSAADAIEIWRQAVEVDDREYITLPDGTLAPNEKFGLTKKTWAKTVADGRVAFTDRFGNTADAMYVYEIGVDLAIAGNEQAQFGFKDLPSWFWMARTNSTIDMLGDQDGKAYIKEQIVLGRIPALISGYFSESTGRSARKKGLSPGRAALDPECYLKADALRNKDFEDYEEYDAVAGYVRNPDRASLLAVYYGREVGSVMDITKKIKTGPGGSKEVQIVEMFAEDPTATLTVILNQESTFLNKVPTKERSAFIAALIALSIEFDQLPDPKLTRLAYADSKLTVRSNEAVRGKTAKIRKIADPLPDDYAESRIRVYSKLISNDDVDRLLATYGKNSTQHKFIRGAGTGAKTAAQVGLGIATAALGIKLK